MTPENWQVQPLATLIESIDSGYSAIGEDRPAGEGEIAVLTLASLAEGRFRPERHKTVSVNQAHKLSVSPKKGRILVSRSNTPELVGAAAYVPQDFPNHFLPDLIWQLAPNSREEFSMHWLFYWLQSPLGRAKLKTIAVGSSPSMVKIGKAPFLKLEVLVPPLAEQRRIAEILSAWDEAIAVAERLIAALRERKRGLMQRLLTGQVRFPEFKQVPWKEQTFGVYLQESRIPGSNGAVAKKLSIKLYGKGVQAKANGQPGSEDTRYYRRKAGQFIYSKLDFLNGAFGIVPAELDGYESTLDLPAFDISREINPSFLLAYVTREGFYKSHLGKARGGRKARRVPPDEFLAIAVPLPAREEQDRIADVLATCDAEITAREQHLALLRQQKRGLMQRLLTGQVRVKVEETPHAPS